MNRDDFRSAYEIAKLAVGVLAGVAFCGLMIYVALVVLEWAKRHGY